MNPVPFIGQRPQIYRPAPGIWLPRRRPWVPPPIIFAQPTNLRAQATGETTVSLLWEDNASNETGYEVERALGDGSFANITTTAANVSTFDDTGLTEGTRYRYRVRAIRAHPTILTNLEAFWNLEETSGTRTDNSAGSNDLTDNATVTGASGQLLQAAQFTRANSEHLSIGDNASLSTGDIDFFVSAWLFLDSKPSAGRMTAVGKWSEDSGAEWELEYDEASDLIRFRIAETSGVSPTIVTRTAASFGSPALSTWIYVAAWADATADTINIQVNNGTVDSIAAATGPVDSGRDFNLGGTRGFGGGTTNHWDGRLDAIGFWKKVPTAAERSFLYNAGTGRQVTLQFESGYTNIATVVAHARSTDTGFVRELTLPRFNLEDLEKASPQPIIDLLNEMAQKIEDKFNKQVVTNQPCGVCVVNGAITLDCGRCTRFEIALDQDINSITMPHCTGGGPEGGTPEIEITTIASTEACVSGWPSNIRCTTCGSASNPECYTQGTISHRTFRGSTGGPLGFSPITPTGTLTPGSGGGGGGIGLAVSCRDEDDNEIVDPIADPGGGAADCLIDCQDGDPKVLLKATGGFPPYSWSGVSSGGGNTPSVLVTGNNGENAEVSPPTNQGVGSNNAAVRLYAGCGSPSTANMGIQIVNCDASVDSCNCNQRFAGGTCPGDSFTVDDGCGSHTYTPTAATNGCCNSPSELLEVCDVRSQADIDLGCAPCDASMAGAVITVTDVFGTSVSITIRVGAQTPV